MYALHNKTRQQSTMAWMPADRALRAGSVTTNDTTTRPAAGQLALLHLQQLRARLARALAARAYTAVIGWPVDAAQRCRSTHQPSSHHAWHHPARRPYRSPQHLHPRPARSPCTPCTHHLSPAPRPAQDFTDTHSIPRPSTLFCRCVTPNTDVERAPTVTDGKELKVDDKGHGPASVRRHWRWKQDF